MITTRKTAWILVSLAVLLCSGCGVPIGIESRVDPAFRGHLRRVFVVSDLAKVSELFGRETGERLATVLREAGVEARVVIRDPLELDESRYLDEMAGFRPDSILLLEPTEKAGTSPQTISSARVNASLVDVETETRYWRANIFVRSGDTLVGMGSYTSQKFCEELVKRLHEDGLIMTAS